MWKYRHSVKDNPKSRYNWSATGQWQTAFCVCQREHWEFEDLVFSQEDNPKTHRLNREISCETGIHWLTVLRIIYRDLQVNCVKRRRAPQLFETNRVARLTRCKQLQWEVQFDFIWFRDEKCLPSNHHSTRRTIGFMHQLITRSDTSIQADCFAYRLWRPLPCHKWVSLKWYLSTMGWRWTASITAMSCCLCRCFQQSNLSQNVVYSQNNMLLTAKLVIFEFCDFPR